MWVGKILAGQFLLDMNACCVHFFEKSANSGDPWHRRCTHSRKLRNEPNPIRSFRGGAGSRRGKVHHGGRGVRNCRFAAKPQPTILSADEFAAAFAARHRPASPCSQCPPVVNPKIGRAKPLPREKLK